MGKCVAWDTRVLDPATGELVTAAELYRRGSAGDWVQVVALDRGGQFQVATPSAFVDDGIKPVFEVTTRLGRVVRTTAAHPFLTDAGWRPLAELAAGTRIAVAARLPYFGHQRLSGGELLLLAHYLGDGGLRGTDTHKVPFIVLQNDRASIPAILPTELATVAPYILTHLGLPIPAQMKHAVLSYPKRSS